MYNLHPSSFSKFILVGDFNVNFLCAHSHLYTKLMYSLSPFNLIQVVESGTRANQHNVSLLDLIFVSVASFLYTCSALPPLGNSDHSGLQLVVQAKGVRRKREGTRLLWNYSQGDYAKASHMINSTNWDMLFSTDINSSLLNWQNQFLHITHSKIFSFSKASPPMANTKNTNSDKEEKQSIQNLEKKVLLRYAENI